MKALTWMAVALLLAAGIFRAMAVWTECRAFGHSLVYCVSMVGR